MKYIITIMIAFIVLASCTPKLRPTSLFVIPQYIDIPQPNNTQNGLVIRVHRSQITWVNDSVMIVYKKQQK